MDNLFKTLGLTAEELELVNGFMPLANSLREHAARIDLAEGNHATYPPELLAEIARQGLWGAGFPEEYGGLPLTYWQYLLVAFLIAKNDAGFSVYLGAHNKLAAPPIIDFGTEEQKQRLLPPMASGEKISCFGLTDPKTGSNPQAMTCRYEHVDGGVRLYGEKAWISNAPLANYATVFAKKAGTEEITCMVVDLDSCNGELSRGEHENKIGIRSSPTGTLTFDGAFVPTENIIGGEGQGLMIALHTLSKCRVFVAAQGCAIAQAALMRVREYASERAPFGKPLSNMATVRAKLANMSIRIHAGMLMVKEAARQLDEGANPFEVGQLAAEAKIFSTDAAREICIEATDIMGGASMVRDELLNRLLRDVLVTTIYEGPNDLLRDMIVGRAVAQA